MPTGLFGSYDDYLDKLIEMIAWDSGLRIAQGEDVPNAVGYFGEIHKMIRETQMAFNKYDWELKHLTDLAIWLSPMNKDTPMGRIMRGHKTEAEIEDLREKVGNRLSVLLDPTYAWAGPLMKKEVV